MTQCSEIRPDLKAYLDNELPTPTNKVVADHLGVCDECSHLLSEMRKVGQVLSSMEKPAEFAFDPKLRAKILSALPTASSPAPKGRVFWPWGRGFQVAGLSAALAALVVVMVVNRNSMDEVNMRSSAESPASGSAASAPKFPSDSARQSESQQKDVSRQENAGTASANDKKAQVEFKNTVGGVADSNRHLNSKQALPKSNDARKSPAIAPSSDAMKLFGSQFDRTASGSTEPDFTRIPPVTGSGATLELKIGKPAVPAPASGKGVDALATKDAPNEKSLARSGIGERPVAPTADSNQMGRGIGRNLSSTRSNIEQLENEVHKVTLVVDSLDLRSNQVREVIKSTNSEVVLYDLAKRDENMVTFIIKIPTNNFDAAKDRISKLMSFPEKADISILNTNVAQGYTNLPSLKSNGQQKSEQSRASGDAFRNNSMGYNGGLGGGGFGGGAAAGTGQSGGLSGGAVKAPQGAPGKSASQSRGAEQEKSANNQEPQERLYSQNNYSIKKSQQTPGRSLNTLTPNTNTVNYRTLSVMLVEKKAAVEEKLSTGSKKRPE